MNICTILPVESIEDTTVTETDILNAMEIFVGMSKKEREETIQGLMATAKGDAKKEAEMEFLLSRVNELEASGSLKQMIRDDEIQKAKREASRQLDGRDWDSFWAMQGEILQATLESGQLSQEDADRFRTDEEAWKKQLRIIWEDLQPKQQSDAELWNKSKR